jgi:hypothetical protein
MILFAESNKLIVWTEKKTKKYDNDQYIANKQI